MNVPDRKRLVAVLSAAALMIFAASSPASPSEVPGLTGRTVLGPGEVMQPGESLQSGNGLTRLLFRDDGNLILYHKGEPLWSSGTARTGVDRLVMGQNGELAMYTPLTPFPQPVWSSNSGGFPGAILSLQDEGGAVIRRPGNPIIWSAALSAPGVGLDGVRHIVYGRGDQMVWLVDTDGVLFDSYLVSGRANSPAPGRYRVFSKSRHTQALDGSVYMEHMVRFVKGAPGRSIGFHSIPVTPRGVPVQTEDELGLFRSAGCVRQSSDKAEQLYDWTPVGTPVVVLP